MIRTHNSQLKIAVVRALHLGDLLLAVPALRSLRAGFPHAEITLIGLPWAEVLARRFRSTYIDRFLPFPGYPGIAEAAVDPARTERFIAEQRAYGYDVVIQMHGSGQTSNPFVRALGARLSVGYSPVGSAPVPVEPVPVEPVPVEPVPVEPTPGAGATSLADHERLPAGYWLGAPYPQDQPEVVRNLGLAALLGCPDRGLNLEFPLCAEDRVEATLLLNGSRLSVGSRQKEPPSDCCLPTTDYLVGLHPGSRSPARRWPPERFAAVADHLSRSWGATIVLTGGPDEVETVRDVARQMVARPVVLAGRTSLGGLAALIERMDLFISNDTGPAHLAVAVGTPSVTIFGPADARRWAPLDAAHHPIVREPVACSPCPHWECPIDHRCLRRIEPRRVIGAAEELLVVSCEL